MPAGRRPKPATVHILNGTHRRDRHGKKEASGAGFEKGIPQQPAELSEKAAEMWHRIVPYLEKSGILVLVDGPALQRLCESWADWVEANDAVDILGITYKTTTMNGDILIKPNPAVAMRSDADRRIRAWFVEFGLTPSSRTKLSGAGHGERPLDPWDGFEAN